MNNSIKDSKTDSAFVASKKILEE